nr:type II toxin-antitoxin system VapC family toxin [Aminobacter aminovorans]
MSATIIDSNVIIDVVEPGSQWATWSRQQIREARRYGDLIFNAIVAAEVSHEFVSAERYQGVFVSTLWTFEDIPFEAALAAGWAHREYRQRGGRGERALPDFLIGAHALVSGHRLLTRDATQYRTYFPELEIIAPDTHP